MISGSALTRLASAAALPARPISRPGALLRGLFCIAALALLAACSGGAPQTRYAGHADGDYAPPGPPGDPWGPYIKAASKRFDVPGQWIRAVIQAESSGQQYQDGKLTTSSAGAMGLMQLMPGTYAELKEQYALGDDPYDPYNNIMAGTAYLRQMYDLYGSPGFLAAYNAGPGRLDDYLYGNRGLPRETRRYVAKIAPNLVGAQPHQISGATQLAMNQLPTYIPPGPRYPRGQPQPQPVVLAQVSPPQHSWVQPPVRRAALPTPPRPVQIASRAPQRQPAGGFHLISPAIADTMPDRRGGPATGNWAIQVGAFNEAREARAAASAALHHARRPLASARQTIGAVRHGRQTLYRARLTGLSKTNAREACRVIVAAHGACIALSPDAQS